MFLFARVLVHLSIVMVSRHVPICFHCYSLVPSVCVHSWQDGRKTWACQIWPSVQACISQGTKLPVSPPDLAPPSIGSTGPWSWHCSGRLHGSSLCLLPPSSPPWLVPMPVPQSRPSPTPCVLPECTPSLLSWTREDSWRVDVSFCSESLFIKVDSCI